MLLLLINMHKLWGSVEKVIRNHAGSFLQAPTFSTNIFFIYISLLYLLIIIIIIIIIIVLIIVVVVIFCWVNEIEIIF